MPEQIKEALAFAVIALLTAHGLPANVPSCTGPPGPAVQGGVRPGHAPLQLPEPARTAPRALVLR